MMKISHSLALASLAIALTVPSGCSSEPTIETPPPIEMDAPPPEIGELGGHEEEHQGPHGGHVVELGRSHEFHAEIVEDDQAQTVTVYVLGADLQPRPIEQPTIQMSLLVDGTPQSFAFHAQEPVEGKTAQFRSTDSAAFEALHEHEAAGKLLVMIDGKSYSGAIEPHDHDH